MALVDRICHTFAVTFERFHYPGKVGDEVVTQTIRVLECIAILGTEVDPVPGALLEDASFKGNIEGCSLNGRHGFAHGALLRCHQHFNAIPRCPLLYTTLDPR